MLYLLSFLILLCAEMCGNFHSFFVIKGNKHLTSLFGALSSALWCIKIVVIVNQPFTIITAFIGAYVGTLLAFHINKLLYNK